MFRQKGQSMIVGLIFMPIVVLFLLYLYNVSQQNLHKTRLQNTADAAVISGSKYLARELNFKAYTNRAMIANHVAVGQYVGLASWFNFAVETFDNIEDIARYVPFIGGYISAAEAWIDRINDSVLQPGLEYAVLGTDYINTILSTSQDIMSGASSASMVESLTEVIERNDPEASLDILSATTLMNTIFNEWRDYQGAFDRRDNTGRYTDFFEVVTDSRDPFLVNRSHNWKDPFTLRLGPCLGIKTKQAGGGELFKNGDDKPETWTSMDTLSLHLRYPSWRGCRKKEKEVGWGAAHAGTDNSTREYRRREYYGKSRKINSDASSKAYRKESAMDNAYSGIQQFYAVKEVNVHAEGNDAPPITIVVSKDFNKLQTSSRLDIGTKSEEETRELDINIEEEAEVPRDKFSTVAKSRIYYYRATDLWNNGRYEYGNLYNPYWQTSLQDVDDEERGYLLGAVFGLDLVGL